MCVAYVKAKVGFEDALMALGMEDNRHCYACERGRLEPTHDGDGYFCTDCAATGDVITLVRAVRDCTFREACEFLEIECLAPRDTKTGDLFQ